MTEQRGRAYVDSVDLQPQAL